MNDELRAVLATHPFARGLGGADLDLLLPLASLVRWRAGAVAFRAGEPADRFFLVRSGRIALEQDVPGRGAMQLESLHAGDVLGLSWIDAGAVWTLDAMVVEPAEAIAIDAAALRLRMTENASLGRAVAIELARELYRRLERVRLQRLDVYAGPR
jgi:CRP/FNR family transcriptional regulator, cyclic AMP receptor protein